MNKYETIIHELESRIKNLEENQISIFMPYEIRDVIKNSIIDRKIDDTTTVSGLKHSQTVAFGAGGGTTTFDVPNNFSGELIVTFKDKVYKIPYYV